MGKNTRSNFSNTIGFMLAAVGGAVGLGNIWGFPYKLGKGGGFPFILVYVICVFLIGVPICMLEYGMGRKARAGAVTAYKSFNKKAGFIGWINMAVCIGVMGFYCLICGWILKYTCMFGLSIFGGAQGFWASDSGTYFGGFIGSYFEPLIWTAIVMAVAYIIIRADIAVGIEKACKVMIPALLAIMVIVAVRACTLPGAKAGLEYLFAPNFEPFKNGGIFAVITLALLQMWFSCNIGFGTNLLYGSYLPDDTSIVKSAIIVPIADMLVALLAALCVMPAVFAYGMEPSAGAGVLFVSLKTVFCEMPGGSIIGFIFFVAVLFAALSSVIGMEGAIAAIGTEQLKWNNDKASLWSCLSSVIIAIPVSLGYSLFADVRPLAWLGQNTDLLDSLDFLCENVLVATGTLCMLIFVGWVWKPDTVLTEIEKTGKLAPWFKKTWLVLIKYVAPIITVIVLLSSVGIL